MHKFSITLRLRLSLVIVIGTALLKVGTWVNLSVYGAIALLWALWLRVRFRPLVQLLGAELLLLTLMALPLGWERASFLLARSLVCLLTMNSFLLSLPPHSRTLALKGLPLPAPLQEILLLATQYLEILLSEITQMQRAAKLRGLGGSAGWLRYISAATIGSLYIRTLHRAERVYSAMVVRGYQGKLPVDTKLTPKETIALTATALVATAVTLSSY
ncbi:MAG: CbiQ family ECF transporter T component [Oscillatoriaceae bacterium SKW80]|nr:CbiQ family ECF transporter T component [Oscillatoriaceae bacterium SKYG93]MCX8121490.1 CbiQ family ECF transporter T component [Oscillatoriaceae bacterium SKW80]MDW8452924.1 CbiQ family ECF transporter T component [Oscillatoriaceae cyanobacterium SKYGB_i_bin93]HIK27835.1 energy-coupling factor transporter transmembrane protein EcfT [Oscillatoriaceae cyanobacterium M7585_C2015_266]